MTVPIEAWVDEGVLVGLVAGVGPLRQRLETDGELEVADLRARALDGRRAEADRQLVPVDALLLVVPGDPSSPASGEVAVHAVWHDVVVAVGPYLVEGRFPTQPGFDPNRALARPSGTFVLLGDAAIRDRADPERVLATHSRLLVNRYEVDLVRSALMLAHHFPGARLEPLETAGDAGPDGSPA